MDYHKVTIDTYNRSAKKLAEHFRGIGPRVKDIELALELAGNPQDARVVEIGCGDGRDAIEIVRRVGWYEGFDPSVNMLELARNSVPNGRFVQADALSYKYPPDLDVVYAFASLLHVDQTGLREVFGKLADAVKQGGVVLVSMKEWNQYLAEIKHDDHGYRQFFLYSPSEVKAFAGRDFYTVHEDHQTIGKTKWFTLALKKR